MIAICWNATRSRLGKSHCRGDALCSYRVLQNVQIRSEGGPFVASKSVEDQCRAARALSARNRTHSISVSLLKIWIEIVLSV
jgi:hypothetical protein